MQFCKRYVKLKLMNEKASEIHCGTEILLPCGQSASLSKKIVNSANGAQLFK